MTARGQIWGEATDRAPLVAPYSRATESGFSRGCRAISETASLLLFGLLVAFISGVCVVAMLGVPLLALLLYLRVIS